MNKLAAAVFALALGLCGCAAPVPVYTAQLPPRPIFNPVLAEECATIRAEIARQQRVADFSGIMATLLVEVSARLNAANVIAALETRAALEGCR